MAQALEIKLHEVEQYMEQLIGENERLKQEQRYLQTKLVRLTQERANLKENQANASKFVKSIIENLKKELG